MEVMSRLEVRLDGCLDDRKVAQSRADVTQVRASLVVEGYERVRSVSRTAK